MTRIIRTHRAGQPTRNTDEEIESLKQLVTSLEQKVARSDRHAEERFQEVWQTCQSMTEGSLQLSQLCQHVSATNMQTVQQMNDFVRRNQVQPTGLKPSTITGYLESREAFLDTQAQHLGVSTQRTKELDHASRKATRHGDALTDAKLYGFGHRRDKIVYKTIYGLEPDEVLQLDRNGSHSTIMILNYHVTYVSIRPDDRNIVQTAFAQFLDTLHRQDGIRTWCDNSHATVKAYEAFRRAVPTNTRKEISQEEGGNTTKGQMLTLEVDVGPTRRIHVDSMLF